MTRDSGGFPLDEAFQLLRTRIPEPPDFLLVLGSGLGGMVEMVRGAVPVPFGEIPGLPEARVTGHDGRFVSGKVEGRAVLVQQGRYHFYEGHSEEVVAAPVRLAARLGARTAIFTNAAGGVASELRPGSIFLLDDHLNLMGRNPLLGRVPEGVQRFPDMSAPYDPDLQELALEIARHKGIPLFRGTYAAVLGPSYETPAEVRAIRAAGAQAVGMSTVPEVTTARALGMRVLAFSLVTNRAAGLGSGPLDHRAVLEMGRAAGRRLGDLVRAVLARLPEEVRTGGSAGPGGSAGTGGIAT
jgi:purine-nucleoside phosphorylase